MTKKEFIFQGFTSRTHAAALLELFDVPDIQQVFLSVAFVSEGGVLQIKRQLEAHASHTIVFAGIRNDITSYQGLLSLHAILGNRLHTVDTGSRNIIFHPKLYMARSHSAVRVIVGSANLTLGGLNNNIEAGVMLDFDLTDAADRAIIDSMESQLLTLPVDYPSHVVKVGAVAELDEMLLNGRLVDEMAISPPRPATSAHGVDPTDAMPRIKLKITPLRRVLTRAPSIPQNPTASKLKTAAVAENSIFAPVPATGIEFDLVWESKPLTRRDLTIPGATGTHATGSINLDKGLLVEEIDHRNYFREGVFSDLVWVARSRTVDETFAKFQLVLRGISYGEFDLAIRHTNSTTSRAYQQKNAMTRLSWGPLREYIASPDLIGRTLALYRDKVRPDRFILEID